MAGTSDPPLQDVIASWVAAGLGDVHTALPAVIVTYNQVLQSATVQPVIRQRVDDPVLDIQRPDLTPIPPISNVPIVWPSGATWSDTAPLVPGDPVTLLFVERSTDEWRSTGLVDNIPQDARRFDISDAVAIPGGRSLNPASGTTSPLGATKVDPVARVIGTSVPGGIKLGSNVAIDAALKGTLFEADLLTYMVAMEIFITATSVAVTAPAIAAAALTFLPSVTAFKLTTSSGAHRSIKILIE